MGFILDCFTGEDSCARHFSEQEREFERKKNRCALDDDPVFGWVLIIALSICVGAVTRGIGFFPFLVWAIWMGSKPCKF